MSQSNCCSAEEQIENEDACVRVVCCCCGAGCGGAGCGGADRRAANCC